MSTLGKVTIWHNCKIVKQSRNLRGILDYARNTSDVMAIHCHKLFSAVPNGETFHPVEFQFRNGAHCQVDWADCRVLTHWIKSRRAWDISAIAFSGIDEFRAAMERGQ